MSYFEKTQIQTADSPSVDAFSRWRVSEPHGLWDSKLVNNTGSIYWTQRLLGDVTMSYDANSSTLNLIAGPESGSQIIRQTKRRFAYQPGKSHMILFTSLFGSPVNGICKRAGYFDENNGLFFCMSGSTFNVTKRSSTSGIPIDTAISQSNWNVDRMDGSGPSGINIDLTKSQIYYIDFEWLGVGRVRFGLNVGGKFYIIHTFDHINELSSTFMSSPNLPIRYECTTHINTTTSSFIKEICSSVCSEDGYDYNGAIRSIDTTFDGNSAGGVPVLANAYSAIILARTKSRRIDASILPLGLSMMSIGGGNPTYWAVLLNPTLSSFTGSYTSNLSSSLEFMTGSGTMLVTSEGYKLASGFYPSNSDTMLNMSNQIPLGFDIDGNADVLVIAARNMGGGTAAVHSSLIYREIT